jgi:hypothetical protein
MPFRRTTGIVSNLPSSDPKTEADVIMTAAALGFAASYIEKDQPIQFDMDPLDVREPAWTKAFNDAVGKLDRAIADYLQRSGRAPKNKVHAGTSPGYTKGAVIVGVYALAGQTAPPSISAPVLSAKGRVLYDQIKAQSVPQYTGRGAYTGFVDNKNTVENTDPVGPRSTARFLAPDPDVAPERHPRWLPPADSSLWAPRRRRGTADSYVPWGLIMGATAGQAPVEPNTTTATNLADQSTILMKDAFGMVFTAEPTVDDIATYTHGMIQAIYKAYGLGPSCTPYEIAVGDQTKKMASCLPCTFFMVATGYPPNSIHLGRGESWAPLYAPYNPGGPTEVNEPGVIRDLNNAWYDACAKFLTAGLQILDDDHIAEDHRVSRDAARTYLTSNKGTTVAATLILDAVSMHESETDRISRTLR